MQNPILDEIQQIVTKNRIVLFMKGTKSAPQCGFSATVVQILNNFKVGYLDIDVLKDQQIRQGIKDFSDWPTIPQLYIDGEFIGGCDIVREMYQDGQLAELLQKNKIID